MLNLQGALSEGTDLLGAGLGFGNLIHLLLAIGHSSVECIPSLLFLCGKFALIVSRTSEKGLSLFPVVAVLLVKRLGDVGHFV